MLLLAIEDMLVIFFGGTRVRQEVKKQLFKVNLPNRSLPGPVNCSSPL